MVALASSGLDERSVRKDSSVSGVSERIHSRGDLGLTWLAVVGDACGHEAAYSSSEISSSEGRATSSSSSCFLLRVDMFRCGGFECGEKIN